MNTSAPVPLILRLPLAGYKFLVRRQHKHLYALGSIVAFAFSIRVYKLELRDLWFDEAFSGALILHLHDQPARFWHILIGFLYLEGLSPLAPWLTSSTFLLRLPSALCGSLSILPLYAIARHLLSRRWALMCCLLFALAFSQVLWSREARYYIFMEFFALLSVAALLKYRRDKASRHAGFCALALLLSLACNPASVLLIPPIAYFFINTPQLSPPARRRARLAFWGILGLGALWPLAWMTMVQRLSSTITTIIPHSPIAHFQPGLLYDILGAFTYGGDHLGHGGSGFEIAPENLVVPRILLVILPLLALLAFIPWRKRVVKIVSVSDKQIQGDTGFVVLWLLLPMGEILLLSYYYPYRSLPRYILFSQPPLLILLCLGLTRLRSRLLSTGLSLAIVILFALALGNLYTPAKPSWKSIAAAVQETSQGKACLLFSPTDQVYPFFYYYDPAHEVYAKTYHLCRNPQYIVAPQPTRSFLYRQQLVLGLEYEVQDEDIRAALAQCPSNTPVIAIRSPIWMGLSADQRLTALLSQNHHLTSEQSFIWDGITVSTYTPNTQAPARESR